MKKILSISVLLIFVAAAGAYAQFGGGGQQAPKFYGNFKPVVGSWAEYQMNVKGAPSTKMKVAVVGKEGPNYWYETVMKGEMSMVTKMLVAGNPSDQQNLKRMIMKTGNEQAMEMPLSGMGMGKPQGKTQKSTGTFVDKGMEKVTVPAGTFTAKHMQYKEGAEVVDAWVSEKVPPYGLVKSKAKDFEMVLLSSGKGAKTLITETPKKFEMPKMPQGMPHGMMPGMGAPPK